MTTTNFSRYSKEMLILINRWAKRLEADEVLIHTDGTVTLTCKDGYICYNYKPVVAELKKEV